MTQRSVIESEIRAAYSHLITGIDLDHHHSYYDEEIRTIVDRLVFESVEITQITPELLKELNFKVGTRQRLYTAVMKYKQQLPSPVDPISQQVFDPCLNRGDLASLEDNISFNTFSSTPPRMPNPLSSSNSPPPTYINSSSPPLLPSPVPQTLSSSPPPPLLTAPSHLTTSTPHMKHLSDQFQQAQALHNQSKLKLQPYQPSTQPLGGFFHNTYTDPNPINQTGSSTRLVEDIWRELTWTNELNQIFESFSSGQIQQLQERASAPNPPTVPVPLTPANFPSTTERLDAFNMFKQFLISTPIGTSYSTPHSSQYSEQFSLN